MSLYVVYSGSNRSFGGGGGGGGSVNSVTASAPLASSGGANPNITISLANTSTDGYLSSVDWNTFNNKQPLLTPGSISTSTTGVTVGSGANSTVGPNVTINIQTASGSQPGLLSSADWNTFNNKQNALTFGNLTDAGTDGIVITGGTGAVIGSGTSLAQHVADATHNGYLSSADWNTFNGKQSALTFVAPLVNTAGSVAINGSVADNKLNFASAADATKIVSFDLSSQTTATTLAITPTNTSNMVLNIPQVATASGAGMALVQDETTGFIFGFGITSSIGAANSMFQLANATVANRAQIKLHSYFNGTSVAGVSTLTSRSGTIAVNAAVVAGQDYSKWTAQACATTPGSAPISGAWAFKANTVNSLTVTSDFHLQLTNLAGTLGDRLILGSEGALQLPNYSTGIAHFDASGNITSSAINLASADVTGTLPISKGGTNSAVALNNNRVMLSSGGSIVESGALTDGQIIIGATGGAPIPASLTAGSGITITPGTNSITIAASASATQYLVNEFTLSGTDITNGFVTLTSTPTTPTHTILNVIGGPMQDYGVDFQMIGANLDWNGLFLSGVLIAGDKLVVQFN